MPHSLVLGMTESGKTTLAKKLSKEYQARGIGVIVLDPLQDPEWSDKPDSDLFFQTTDKDEFLASVKASKRCAVFIDESGESVGQYDTAMHWLATRGRHYGHNCHFLSQRGQQIAKTVRDQCGRLYLFTCSLTDAKILADEWNKPELREAHGLEQGQFFIVRRFSGTEIASAFDDKPARKLLDKKRAKA